MSTSHESRRIHILRDSVSRRIAAGEVIDRPLSVVRELLDNSIDAGAENVEVRVDGGGVQAIRVTDDGAGMSRADLELCVLPHATSKIDSAEDIYRVTTLGFRGEALSSIAACSKLEIMSTERNSEAPGARILVHGGDIISLDEAPRSPGTIVSVTDLFYSLPGRKRFLRRPGTESAACAGAFVEKALAFPDTTFRYFADGQMKRFLPAAGRVQRIEEVYAKQLGQTPLLSLEGDYEGYSITLVAADPSFTRRDRRLIQVFVNDRRIDEYSLVQAVTYAYSPFVPGGRFPFACVFIRVDPNLVDFNIHPAKRQVRFRNLPDIHRRLTALVADSLQPFSRTVPVGGDAVGPPASLFGSEASQRQPQRPGTPPEQQWRYATSLPDGAFHVEESHASTETAVGFRYLGQVFGLFLVIERGDSLYLVDQHAAHERILFERLKAGANDRVQTLLVPIEFDLEEDEAGLLEADLPDLAAIGIAVQERGKGRFAVAAYPETCSQMEGELLDWLVSPRGSKGNLEQELYADLSCKAAVRDGDHVDRATAISLVEQAFSLENAHCPHGRPIWHEISRPELFQLVGRE